MKIKEGYYFNVFQNIYYCHPNCQKMDWCNHKVFCKKIDKEKQGEERRCFLGDNAVSKKIVENVGSVSNSGTIQDGQSEDVHVEKVAAALADIKFA